MDCVLQPFAWLRLCHPPKVGRSSTYLLWHDRLGHSGRDTMCRILKSSHMHPLPTKDLAYCNTICQVCSLKKLITRPSPAKITKAPILFLRQVQGDICGPIQPPCGPFHYFMVLDDASTHRSHVYLLSTRNVAFAKLIVQIIKLRAHHSDYPIKSIRLDNADEFTLNKFDDYCMSFRIEVEHHVPHIHTQIGH